MLFDLFESYIKFDNITGVLNYLSAGRDPDEFIMGKNITPIELAHRLGSEDVEIALLEFGARPYETQKPQSL